MTKKQEHRAFVHAQLCIIGFLKASLLPIDQKVSSGSWSPNGQSWRENSRAFGLLSEEWCYSAFQAVQISPLTQSFLQGSAVPGGDDL